MDRSPWALNLAIVLLLTGCNHLEVRDRWFDSDRVSKVPTEILPIWTDTVLHQPGQPGIRGFGGRVYFYEEGKPDPVMVDGQLVVYAFDGSSKDPTIVAPLRKFVITADQMTTHHSDSSLGNSYSVWLPWDKVGGASHTLSLVVRFNGREGGAVLSKPSRMLLPGVDPQTPLDNERKSGIQLASHESVHVEKVNANESMVTASIDLPPSFQRRLAGAIPESAESQQTQPPQSGGPEIAPQTKVTAEAPTNSNWEDLPSSQLEARFAPQRFPARRTPRVQPGRALVRRQPHPAAWPSELARTPRSDSNWRSNQDSPTRVSARQEIGSLTRRWQTQSGAASNTVDSSAPAVTVD